MSRKPGYSLMLELNGQYIELLDPPIEMTPIAKSLRNGLQPFEEISTLTETMQELKALFKAFEPTPEPLPPNFIKFLDLDV